MSMPRMRPFLALVAVLAAVLCGPVALGAMSACAASAAPMECCAEAPGDCDGAPMPCCVLTVPVRTTPGVVTARTTPPAVALAASAAVGVLAAPSPDPAHAAPAPPRARSAPLFLATAALLI